MELKRSAAIISLIVFSVLAIIIFPDILGIIFGFIFMGIVPGTDIMLPSWVSLLLILIALIFAIRWMLDTPTYRTEATVADKSRRHTARRKVLKKTAQTVKSTARKPKKQTARA